MSEINKELQKIIVIGKTCSGKSTTVKIFKDDFRIAKLSTTRPPRNQNDNEYYFLQSYNKIKDKEKYVYVEEFNNWFYGLSLEECENSDFIITTPYGAKKIKEFYPKSIVYYLDIDLEVRKKRFIERAKKEDFEIASKEFKRRILTEEEQFKDLDFVDFYLKN